MSFYDMLDKQIPLWKRLEALQNSSTARFLDETSFNMKHRKQKHKVVTVTEFKIVDGIVREINEKKNYKRKGCLF